MILENTIKQASEFLKKNKISTHQLDAQIILADILGVSKEFLLINENVEISNKIKKKYDKAIQRRKKNEPVAYITGKKEFWSNNFDVSSATLVPRPETELLIYKIVDIYKNKKISILDIGTGSGCILISILRELKFSKGLGIDISSDAIKIAKQNSQKFNLKNRSKFKVCDVNNLNVGKYDLIVTNPPYIAIKDIKNLSKDIINYEPIIALNGGIDGLDLIKKIIYKSNNLLKKNGLFVTEIGNQQYLKVSWLLMKNGFREISKVYDYKRNVRCIMSTKI
tara:strand:- start:1063 stop:1902 length:840 start_codon:yes stop_codon:yes gene_type:complete